MGCNIIYVRSETNTYKVYILVVPIGIFGIPMNPEGHLEKARAFENRAQTWKSDRDAPSVIEDIFNATVHYLAYGINIKFGKDIDSHSSQKRFLRQNNENEIWITYDEIERLRIKAVYGGGWNGEKIKRGLDLLEDVKKWIT